jgi:hypothetical protein
LWLITVVTALTITHSIIPTSLPNQNFHKQVTLFCPLLTLIYFLNNWLCLINLKAITEVLGGKTQKLKYKKIMACFRSWNIFFYSLLVCLLVLSIKKINEKIYWPLNIILFNYSVFFKIHLIKNMITFSVVLEFWLHFKPQFRFIEGWKMKPFNILWFISKSQIHKG